MTVHISVLKDESLEYLQCHKGGRYVDCTLGGAGHSQGILEANKNNTVVAFDRDQRAIERAKTKLASYKDRITYHCTSFSQIDQVLSENSFDGVLVDLGISTDQLKENRGFSFNDDSPLDMRMDQAQQLSAEEVVNTYNEKDLIKVLKRGGADKEGYAAAKAIIKNRPIQSTRHLSEVVSEALKYLSRSNKNQTGNKTTHPATTVFQAIRIEVNKEYEEIEAMLKAVPGVVRQGGRLAVITFHSSEDKLVAGKMRTWAAGDTTPAKVRGAAFDRGSLGRFLTTKPVVASARELAANPAARSARLRVFEFGV